MVVVLDAVCAGTAETDFWPSLIDRLWPRPTLANLVFIFLFFRLLRENSHPSGPRRVGPRRVGPRRVGPSKGGGPNGGGPNVWGPKISRFFFPSPATVFILFSLSFGLFRGILVVFASAGALIMCTFGVLGQSCASPGGPTLVGPPGFHTTAREPKRATNDNNTHQQHTPTTQNNTQQQHRTLTHTKTNHNTTTQKWIGQKWIGQNWPNH